jgi:hypothetical protein
MRGSMNVKIIFKVGTRIVLNKYLIVRQKYRVQHFEIPILRVLENPKMNSGYMIHSKE